MKTMHATKLKTRKQQYNVPLAESINFFRASGLTDGV